MSETPYEIVIGLEVHVQLATKSKLFSRASTTFGAAPNTQTSVVDLGLPGTLPVMNRAAFQLAMKTAVALHCHIPGFTKWDRKHYYYPDLPKGYQISQYDLPMSQNGWLEISDPKGAFAPKRVGIIRAHLEEDAGKSMHDEAAGKADSRIDLNRVGTPLLEIVSEPDMSSPKEAKAYLKELRLLLLYLGVSDCNMQEGSLRVDANVNLRVAGPRGVVATPIVEVKNMNSFSAVEKALAYEAGRQYAQWQETGVTKDNPVKGVKTTRGWDDQRQTTYPLRSKEEASDYRYFPDPDLVPVRVSPDEVEHVRRNLVELPAEIRSRLEHRYGVTPYDSDVIVSAGRATVDYYVALAEAAGDGKRASNWLQQDVMRVLNERKQEIGDFPLPPAVLGGLVKAVAAGELDNARARDVYAYLLEHGGTHEAAMRALGIEKLDDSALEAVCREVLARNPKIVEEVRGGKPQAVGRLIGETKKQQPNVDPGKVRELLLQLIAEA